MKKLLLILLCLPMIGFGQIIFSEITGTSFIGVEESSVKFSDIDGDGDEDILITGRDVNNTAVFNVYANDGIGNFSMITGLVFDGVFQSSLVTLDIDGDFDLDVLVSGRSQSLTCITKLYENDGTGNFNEVLGTSFIGVHYCSIAFSDIDSDNDYDVLISGKDCNGFSITKLYINDGIGNFNEVPGTSFIGVHFCSIAFSDVDGDNDQDILITGYTQNALLVSKLYTNDGSGNFTEVTGFPVIGLAESSIAFSDIDGDNDQDLFVTGWAEGWIETSKLYINDGLGNFSEPSGASFIGVTEGDVLFLDVDCDNDQDILYTGYNSGSKIIKLYKNDGNLLFNNVTGLSLTAVEYCSIASSDIDNDNDNDLLITGEFQPALGPITKLYRNNTCTYGCTDSLACNYDPLANVNDSVCYYNSTSYDTLISAISINWNGMTLTVSGDYSVALVNSAGCDSISNLNLTITSPTGILDMANKRNLLKITDMLGQETPYRKNQPLLYIYDDGTVEKRIVIE